MDPLSAIGLASAIVQFVQFGFQVADRLEKLTTDNPGQIPKALQTISMHLPLLANSLSKIKSDARVSALDFDTKCILKGIVSGCMVQVQEIEAMLGEIACAPGDSLRAKIKKVMASMKYEEKLSRIERSLSTYISVLILHHVVDAADAPKSLQEETYFDVREKLDEDFVERKNLVKELDEHLYDASRSQVTEPAVLLLSGKKGVGKTQLALGYARVVYELQQFRSVFWLDASSLEKLSLGFERMYATLQRTTQGSRQDKITFARNFLEDLWHPWLLVLDNYDASTLYNNIMDFLPSRGCGAILLLSQDCENGLGKVMHVPRYLHPHEQQRANNTLINAVQNQNLKSVKEAVEGGADVNSMVWDQWPCIHRLALFGQAEALQYLVERGANMNIDARVESLLDYGAMCSDENDSEATCRLLLDYEDKEMVQFTPAMYQSAFMYAVEHGNLESVKMILKRRRSHVNIKAKNRSGETAIVSAAYKGKLSMVKFFIDTGLLKDDETLGGGTLYQAVVKGHLEMVKVLCLEAGITPDSADEDDGILAKASDSGYNKDTLEIAEILLQQGANPNAPIEHDGLLHKACYRGEMDFVKLMLKYKADPTIEGSPECPLRYAIRYNNQDVIQLLLAVEIPDVEKRKSWINDALLFAARRGDRAAVLQMLEQGADINARQRQTYTDHETSLIHAVNGGHVQTAQFLVRRKADQTISDSEGQLPLPLAVKKGLHLVVRDLIRAGGDANMKSGDNQDTLLMIAVTENHEKVVEVLLKNGADADLSNKFGEIAMDIAAEKDYEEIIKLLESNL